MRSMTSFGRLQILAQFANIHYLHFALSQFAHIVTITLILMACTTGYALSLQILLFQVTNWLTSLSDAAICWARENKQDARKVSMMQSFEMQTGAYCHCRLSNLGAPSTDTSSPDSPDFCAMYHGPSR